MGLLLNRAKTKAIVVGTRRFIAGISFEGLPSVVVVKASKPFSSEVVCLGVTISSTLSCNSNTTKIVKKVNGVVHQLKLCQNLLPQLL